MELSKLLVPGAVRVVGQFTSKKRLFQELGEIAAQAYGLSGAAAMSDPLLVPFVGVVMFAIGVFAARLEPLLRRAEQQASETAPAVDHTSPAVDS